MIYAEVQTRITLRRKQVLKLRTAAQAIALIRRDIGPLAHECFGAIYMDAGHRPIIALILATGGPSHCAVELRDIFYHAMRVGAAAAILFHNHPGAGKASAQDRRVTSAAKIIGKHLGVEILDHIIVKACNDK